MHRRILIVVYIFYYAPYMLSGKAGLAHVHLERRPLRAYCCRSNLLRLIPVARPLLHVSPLSPPYLDPRVVKHGQGVCVCGQPIYTVSPGVAQKLPAQECRSSIIASGLIASVASRPMSYSAPHVVTAAHIRFLQIERPANRVPRTPSPQINQI